MQHRYLQHRRRAVCAAIAVALIGASGVTPGEDAPQDQKANPQHRQTADLPAAHLAGDLLGLLVVEAITHLARHGIAHLGVVRVAAFRTLAPAIRNAVAEEAELLGAFAATPARVRYGKALPRKKMAWTGP